MHQVLIVHDPREPEDYTTILSCFPDLQLSFATSGRQALEHIEAQGDPAVLVLDNDLPDMNAWQFVQRYDGAARRLPAGMIIVGTRFGEDEARRTLAARASFLRKPLVPGELRALVLMLAIAHLDRLAGSPYASYELELSR